jgi:hypothetical protein
MPFIKGNTPWNKDKKLSLETCQKLSEAKLGHIGDYIKRVIQ